MPKLFHVDRPWWWRLYRSLKEWLEMRSKYSGKLIGRYSLLA